MIHIEGMGWFGAAMAYRLHADGIPFTWHDIDTPVNAWQASAGMVYPAGDDRSTVNLTRWPTLAGIFPPGTVIPAAFAYPHTHPPHAGTYRTRLDLGWIRVADAPAYAVDVPAIVNTARAQFADRRLSGPVPGKPTIIAHGHTDRRSTWIWSWTAPVRLHLPDALHHAVPERIAFYGRTHRFARTYAFPIPTRPNWWWAGTSLLNQRRPHPLNPDLHLTSWRRNVGQLYPWVRIVDNEPAIHGWRARQRPDDRGYLECDGDRLMFPALANSGVRWAPTLLDDAAAWAAARTRTHV
ncbi:hypothetical protein [Micromonospora sp. WMMC273]|uniref:hypothetical protein n=1 Tax=Micromonospora sp. WMMC273 TaxID=3015157 RepID=UPI0022B6B06F|nr:hypothetical protein [Micromonospora sp. WMMC273]MCZ7478927.1 hypothetical protein [Micromonospora sp. WMMC273]MCZ7478988.1 hypothetical protein [Micromonospora sp. WMMC273]